MVTGGSNEGMTALAKAWVGGLIAVLLLALPASAQDFEKGLAAKKRGDFAAALALWRPLAQRGDPAAQNAIGLLYDNGQGVPQDPATALMWYRRAAKKGNADAQNNLGMLYANGLGVPQDYAKAAMWYRRAARQGHAGAKANLGVLHLMGRIPDDASRAARAERGGTDRAPAGARKESEVEAAESALARAAEGAAPGSESRAEAQPRSRTETKSGTETKTKTGPKAEAKPGAAKARSTVPAPQVQRAAAREDGKTPAKPDKIERIAKLAESAKASPAAGKALPADGKFRVQLSSVKTELRAMKEAQRLKRAHESLLGGLRIEPVRADLGPRGVFYRLYAGPLATFDAARSLCRKLSARNQGCIVIRRP